MPGFFIGPTQRMLSPPGASILMMSAPISPRICVANGPITTVVRSSILMPASGPQLSEVSDSILFNIGNIKTGNYSAGAASKCIQVEIHAGYLFLPSRIPSQIGTRILVHVVASVDWPVKIVP